MEDAIIEKLQPLAFLRLTFFQKLLFQEIWDWGLCR